MRIAIITPVFPPYYAGIGRVAEQEAEGLAKLGHEVTVFTPDFKRGRHLVILTPDQSRGEESRPFLVNHLKPFFKFGNAAWLPSLADELQNFDVIHLHYPFIGGAGSLLKYKIHGEKYKVPMVVTYHMDLVGRGWRGLFFKLYTRLTLPKIVRAADKIIVSSLDYARHSDLAPYLEREPGKFVEVPFGIRASGMMNQESGIEILTAEDRLQVTGYRLQETKIADLRQKLGIRNGAKVILFVGGLDKAHYFKGVGILLKAFQKSISNIQYPISKLLIMGEGNLRQRYERQAKGLGLENNVIFAGRVPPADLPSYYQLADVLVLPSTTCSEAYGLVILEAMSHGVPVIASDMPGVRTNVSAERGILVKPGDVEDLARVLSEILGDDVKRKEMGERARQWVERERGLDKEIEELDKIFKNCYIKYVTETRKTKPTPTLRGRLEKEKQASLRSA